MTSPQRSTADHIHLDATDTERQVFITGENEDRFILPVPEAVRHIQVGESRSIWNDELNAMLSMVYEWCRQPDKQKHIVGCHAAPCDGSITIFVVPARGRFDFDLADEITELGIRLSKDYPLIPSNVFQIPGNSPDDLAQFVDTRIAITLYEQE